MEAGGEKERHSPGKPLKLGLPSSNSGGNVRSKKSVNLAKCSALLCSSAVACAFLGLEGMFDSMPSMSNEESGVSGVAAGVAAAASIASSDMGPPSPIAGSPASSAGSVAGIVSAPHCRQRR